MSIEGEIIDLTTSFTLANNCLIQNEIISLDSDESFDYSEPINREPATTNDPPLQLTKKPNKPQAKRKAKSFQVTKIKRGYLGECPICWSELGVAPLASTRCGHVYCLKCIKKCLKVKKCCPTCRCILMGPIPYHPLYLSKS